MLEKDFVKEFIKAAKAKGLIPYRIPDPSGSYQNNSHRIGDILLTVKHAIYIIEAKIKNRDLTPNEKGIAEEIEKLNWKAYWIIRKRELKAGIFYSVEKFRNNRREIIMQSQKIEDIVNHFIWWR